MIASIVSVIHWEKRQLNKSSNFSFAAQMASEKEITLDIKWVMSISCLLLQIMDRLTRPDGKLWSVNWQLLIYWTVIISLIRRSLSRLSITAMWSRSTPMVAHWPNFCYTEVRCALPLLILYKISHSTKDCPKWKCKKSWSMSYEPSVMYTLKAWPYGISILKSCCFKLDLLSMSWIIWMKLVQLITIISTLQS